jgi:hypothetical protein
VQSLTQERIWDAAECGNEEVLQELLHGAKTGDFMFGKRICEVCVLFFNLLCNVLNLILPLPPHVILLTSAAIQPFGDTYSALGIAAFKGHTSVATMLVKAGADVNYKIPTVLTASQNVSRLALAAVYFASQCLVVMLPMRYV